jgi:hypothetical protein
MFPELRTGLGVNRPLSNDSDRESPDAGHGFVPSRGAAHHTGHVGDFGDPPTVVNSRSSSMPNVTLIVGTLN